MLAESPKKQMKLSEHITGDVLTIAVAGHLSASAAETLETRLLETTQDGARWIVLDCSRLYSMDIVGLRAVLQNVRRLNALGGALVLCDLRSNIQKLFDISGFDKECLILPSSSAGIKALTTAAKSSPQARIDPTESDSPST